jgi:butyrate kinase
MEKTVEFKYKVFVINPGSTSTKIALFKDDQKVFQENVDHDAETLKKFKEISDQLPFRMDTIRKALRDNNISLTGVAAFAARSGGLVSLEGGIYPVNDKLLEHVRIGYTARHPNTLGPQIALELQKEYGGQIFCVNPPDVDELDDVERVCGFHEFSRQSKGHPLNQKENCIRYAASLGRKYEEMNLICCHIGGGVTVAAHRQGKYFCVNDAVNGDGPMAPTRSGWLPAVDLMRMCFSGKYTEKEMYDRITKTGGLTDLLGTSEVRDILKLIDSGDCYAKLVYDAFIFQLAKAVGGCAAALKGKVDAIILTGGIAHEKYLVKELSSYVSWIAPISVQAGEFEMEALAAGAVRALKGEEELKEYTGIPAWQSFDTYKR